MRNYLHNRFNRALSKGSYKSSKAVYRDELNTKPSPKKVNKGDCFGNKERGYENHKLERGSCVINEEKHAMIRVKVKMTKQEAARLMSRCNDGGVLGFKDLASELMRIPLDRVSVVSCSGGGGYGGVLNTIPEED